MYEDMREFYKEIDRKNRIFDRKTDILRKEVAGYAREEGLIRYLKLQTRLINIISSCEKRKTYLTDYKNSQEKEQTDVFCNCQGKFIKIQVTVY